MTPEKLVELRIAQFDIILCWVIYIFQALFLPMIVTVMFFIEHKLSQSIQKSEAKMKLQSMRKK